MAAFSATATKAHTTASSTWSAPTQLRRQQTEPALRHLSSSAYHETRRRSGACDADNQPNGVILTERDDKPVSEQRLVHELRLLLQTRSQPQREIIWGLYTRLVESGVGAHTLASNTLLCLIELIAHDEDSSRALARIAHILDDVTSMRKLEDDEIETVRLLWEHFEDEHSTFAIWRPLVWKRGSTAPDLPDCGLAANTLEPVSAPDSQLLTESDDKSACVNVSRDSEKATRAVTDLRQLLEQAPILVDPGQVWQSYCLARCTRTSESDARLDSEDMRLLIEYCGNLGRLAGRRFLMQIEIDLGTAPDLFPRRHTALIITYAKLGLLEHARRLYQKVCSSGSSNYDDGDKDSAYVDWCMCQALFSASHHKEGRVIFDNLVKADQVDPSMYYFLIREYVLMQNIDQAFALFDDMCHRSIPLNNRTINMLAVACALDNNVSRATERLATVVACMRSWRLSPDMNFFVGLLKGYDRSSQHTMFDGLAAQLRARNVSTSLDLDTIIMQNAASRGDTELTMAMAELVAQSPDSIPSVVKILCKLGRADYVPKLVPLHMFPNNNTIANVRLELAISDPKVAIQPHRLLKHALAMMQRGFTPSFRLTRDIIEKIWLCGGRQLAIQAYEQLTAAGAPKSVNVMLLALKLYSHNTTKEESIGAYEELREHLAAADFNTFVLPQPAISALAMVLIEKRGIDAAQAAFDFLSTLPTLQASLPFTPLIQYYVNSNMVEKLEVLLRRIVQHDIPLNFLGIDLCCEFLVSNSKVVDVANFLRYLEHTNTLDYVSDSVFEKFFAMCATEYRAIDFEWAVGALIKIDRRWTTWQVIIDCLAAKNKRVLLATVRLAIRLSSEKLIMAGTLLQATSTSAWRAVLADDVAVVLREYNIAVNGPMYEQILQAIITTYKERKVLASAVHNYRISTTYLIEALSRNILPAVKADVKPELISSALLIISSSSPTAYEKCLGLLRDMHVSQRQLQFYAATARGCARQRSVTGIEEVMRIVLQHSITPNVRLLNIVMNCYACSIPQSMSHIGPLVTQSDLEQDQVQEQDKEPDLEELDAPTFPNAGTMAPGHLNLQIQEVALNKVLSIWEQIGQLELSPDHETYKVMLLAAGNAHKFKMGEDLIAHMVDSGLGLNPSTVYGWIRLRVLKDDIEGALTIFDAIGNAEKSNLLGARDARYRELQSVAPMPSHFVIFIHRYISSQDLDTAMVFFRQLHMQGLKASLWLYSLLLSNLANADRRELFIETMKYILVSNIALDSEVMQIVREYYSATRSD
ncbi:hypothetical protein IWW56_001303 [Coemansia sp. RSA 2131]|nr:hypothetical protein IWW56_001303 [Coemansia sp. RSA 2131]